MMFWDKAAGAYDLFENIYNGKVNRQLCLEVEALVDQGDKVLECACGTGMLSRHIAKRAKRLLATDFSVGMLRQAVKNCAACDNIVFRRADIMKLNCRDEMFDKAVAGNVIHLLDDPKGALAELMRVCKPGGKVIVPTYVNRENSGSPDILVKVIGKLGAGFRRQFDYTGYQNFFADAGYENVEYRIIEGRMPCAIAVITK